MHWNYFEILSSMTNFVKFTFDITINLAIEVSILISALQRIGSYHTIPLNIHSETQMEVRQITCFRCVFDQSPFVTRTAVRHVMIIIKYHYAIKLLDHSAWRTESQSKCL